MTGELIINGKDAWNTWRVFLSDGAYNALEKDAASKPYITNESRLEHGIRVAKGSVRVSDRDVIVPFSISGETREDFLAKRRAFVEELRKGVTMKVTELGQTYHLLYDDVMDLTFLRNIGNFSVRFKEPNPTIRE